MNVFRTRDVKMPNRAHAADAGMDVFIPNAGHFYKRNPDKTLTHIEANAYLLMPGESILIPAGFLANVPEDHALIALNKSGVASKKDIVIGAQVIDEPYQGEIHIDLHNIGTMPQEIVAGQKITQLVCLPVNYVEINESASEAECFKGKVSDRGTTGFGDSGDK